MTVTYNGSFLGLLRKWKGSLWKCIWRELIVFIFLYYCINMSYRFWMTDDTKTNFEKIVLFFNRSLEYIPITFLLGFFVTQVVSRWWDQFLQISWPDEFMLAVYAFLPSADNSDIRMTLARWLNLTSVLAWRIVSVKIYKRFPNTKVLVQSGLMTDEEGKMFDGTTAPYGKFWLPNIWMINLIKKCYQDGRISGLEMAGLIEEINEHRKGLKNITLYDWISLPLVYTQVATIATYGYFAVALLGRQLLDLQRPIPKESNFHFVDVYFPIVTTLEFLFYMGWLKVAEELINPFGEDEQDFEMNHILDRNIQVSFLIAETGAAPSVSPEQSRLVGEKALPHTVASLKAGADRGYSGHLHDLKLDDDAMRIVPDKSVAPAHVVSVEMDRLHAAARHRTSTK